MNWIDGLALTWH